MFLKSLSLKGFKSFADPVALHLEPGVTVVVGPNGSGKSNVVDAIAWVLGAQGARALRGSKMEDVIFAGSADRPALGRAEVALTIDNRTGRLPGGLAEITITRTLFRSGDSEYALNGQPCRLLDIQELLSDSGVGRTQHVIVSQGQLDQILSARPEDRRAVIEEAAGVLKHRRRRERAERRLAAADENLERLADLLRELRRQIRPLERQASAARSYGRLADELRALRLYLAGRDLVSLSERIRVSSSERDRFRGEAAQMQETLRGIDAAIEKAASDLSSRDDDDLVVGLARTQGLAERCVGLGGVLSERRRSLVSALAAAADVDVVSSLEADAASLVAQIADAESEQANLAPAFAMIELEEADLETESSRLRLMEDASSVRAARDSVAAVRTKLEAASRSIDIDRSHLSQLESRSESTRLRLSVLERQSAELGVELAQLRTTMSGLTEREERASRSLEDAQRSREAAESEAAESARAAARADSRAESLGGALDELHGTAGRDALVGASGVVGALESLIEVDPGFEGAFETAFSGAISSVVVDGGSVSGAVGLLHARGLSGSLLPSTPRSASLVALPPGSEPLRAHVRGRTRQVEKLLDRLLSGTAVTRGGWRVAVDLALDNPELTFVTIDGDRFSPGGWTVGLSARGLTPALVDEARAASAEAGRLAGVSEDAASRAKESVQSARRALTEVAAELSEIAERHGITERAADQADAVARALREEIGESEPVRIELRTRIETAESGLGALRDDLVSETERAEQIEQRSASAERARADQSIRVSDLAQRRRELEVQAGAITERRQVLSGRLRDVEERLSGHADARRQAEARRTKILADSIAIERLSALVGSHQSAVESVAEQLQELRDRQMEVLRAGGARLNDLRSRRHETDEKLGLLRDRHQKLDVELAEIGARHQAAVEALERELDCSPDEAITTDCPELPDGVQPQTRANELHAELTKMGPINPLAAEELSALEERNEFLEREVDDVRRSRRDLQQVIRMVDDEISSLFATAFTDVDRHFQILVETMFPGGAGRLSLTDPTDPLGTGVELEARPAGKQVRKLSLLSGGERSLVALAFLFAVFRSRPSPFYVLDEVEAALDDVNLHRFLELLHEFRDEAQLIVVSHQKRTMESADALYGVTMTPGGSSKVVSQKVKAKPTGMTHTGSPVVEPV